MSPCLCICMFVFSMFTFFCLHSLRIKTRITISQSVFSVGDGVTQWRSQGQSRPLPPPPRNPRTATNIVILSVVHTTITITFFFLREAFCGLEYAQNAFATTLLAELMTLPRSPSRLRRGHRSPWTPRMHSAQSAWTFSLGSAAPTHTISVYATGVTAFKLLEMNAV